MEKEIGSMSSKEAVEYLKIDEKSFNNYFKNSDEIKGFKSNGRYWFKKEDLDSWNKLKNERTVILSLKEYEKCF